MKRLLRFALCVVLLLVAVLSAPEEARADLTCSDCIRVCFLAQCGFLIDPECEAAVYDYCANEYCAEYCQ